MAAGGRNQIYMLRMKNHFECFYFHRSCLVFGAVCAWLDWAVRVSMCVCVCLWPDRDM